MGEWHAFALKRAERAQHPRCLRGVRSPGLGPIPAPRGGILSRITPLVNFFCFQVISNLSEECQIF
jgi:hypothetical protein